MAQRAAIAAAQKELRAELAGTKHKVSGESMFFRDMSLEVGPDALAVLANSRHVLRVGE